MRPQLLVGGLLISATGAGFYLLPLPFVYFWSVPFAIVGVVMMVASLFLAESPGPIKPREGFRFCPYCSTEVAVGVERCPHCNGLQPREA